MPSEKPLIYLILGASGSGRREVLVDLIEGGLTADDKPAVLLAHSEEPNAVDAKLPRLSRWSWTDEFIAAEMPTEASHVFFLLDGHVNPVDQIEVFKDWIGAQGGELARVIAIIDCQLASKNSALLSWFEACVHFSDVVLLTHRE